MTHSIHLIYGYMVKEGNSLFNDTLDTFLFTIMWHVLFNDTLNTF